METLVYDIGKSRYINLTDRCSLRCRFCPKFNREIRNNLIVKGHNLTLKEQPTERNVIKQLGNISEVTEVVFCGLGESTQRLSELISLIKHIKTFDVSVRLNTDGLGSLIHKGNISWKLANAGLDAISISLNAHNEALYNLHCRPIHENSFYAVLDFIEEAVTYIPKVTVTAIKGLAHVDINVCERLAIQRGALFRERLLDNVG